MTVFRGWIRELTYGFLLVPGLVALGFIALAFVLISVDHALALDLPLAGDAAGARQAVASIAGSLITVAGLSFSITIVTLQLVSSQFSPRAVRAFLTDRVSQVIAGIFVGTSAYCLLVLVTIRDRDADQPAFVPAISVSVAVLLGVASLGVLLVFVHHMSQSLQVSRIARSIGTTALEAVERLYPEPYGHSTEESADEILDALRSTADPATVLAKRPGYVQLVAIDDMVRASEVANRKRDGRNAGTELVLRIPTVAGDFVTLDTTLVELWPPEAERATGQWLRRSIRVVDERDIRQDVGYALRQLVDIALRAISPGINDPTTALTCLGYIRAIMERLAPRDFPRDLRRFPEERLVVVASHRTFDMLAVEAFAEIAHYGRQDPRVMVAVLSAVEATALAARRAGAKSRVRSLVALAETISAPALDAAQTDLDRQTIERCLARVRDVADE